MKICELWYFYSIYLAFLHELVIFAIQINNVMNIAIFCSANNDIDQNYISKTNELGRWLAENHHTIVYGGSDSGLMECVAKASHDAGGRVIGVIPTIVEKGGRVSDYVDVSVRCDNLSDRKDLMIAKSDTIIALPGGVGTLDEVFTVVASASIGYHHKSVILYNMDGFWDKLVALLDDLTAKRMIRGDYHDQIKIANKVEDVERLLPKE